MRRIALLFLFVFRSFLYPEREEGASPDNYRKVMIDEVLDDPEAIGKRLKLALKRYFKEPEEFDVLIYPTDRAKVPLGFFSRVDVKFKRTKIKVLEVEEGSIQIYGLRINLPSLYRDKTIRIRSLDKTKFHFKIKEEALNEAIAKKNLPVHNAQLSIHPGKIAFTASFRTLFIKSHVETKGRLEVEDKTKIKFHPDRLKLNRVPIPGFVKQAISKKINPILDLDDFEFIDSIDSIELKHGLIELISK